MHELEIGRGRGTVAYARTASRSVLPSCDEHGRLEQVDADALDVTLNGTTWALRPGVEVFACPECIDAHLRPNASTRADEALLRDEIREEWTDTHRPGTLDSRLYEVDGVNPDAATPKFCLYCSADLDTSGDGVRCPVHGRLAIDVAVYEEARPA